MKILFLMDSRATYSYSRNVLIHFKNKKKLKHWSLVLPR